MQSLGWFFFPWPEAEPSASISLLELVPVVVATAVWGHYWTGQHVCFHSDSMGVVSVLRSRTAETEFQMHLLHCFSLHCSIFKFSYSAVHIPGSQNTAADALLCNDLSTFLSLVPQTPQVVIPQATLNLFVCNKPTRGSQDWTTQFSLSLTEVCPLQPWLLMSQGRGSIRRFAGSSI